MGVSPQQVPTTRRELLATSYGMLLNELTLSPGAVLDGILRLLQGALALDTGTVMDGGEPKFNSGVQIVLYAVRLGARLDNYLSFMIDNATAPASSSSSARGGAAATDRQQQQQQQQQQQPIRLPLGAEGVAVLALLCRARGKMRRLLFTRYLAVLDSYLRLMQAEIDDSLGNNNSSSGGGAGGGGGSSSTAAQHDELRRRRWWRRRQQQQQQHSTASCGCGGGGFVGSSRKQACMSSCRWLAMPAQSVGVRARVGERVVGGSCAWRQWAAADSRHRTAGVYR